MSFVGILDCNNFFVSCERLFRPDLEARPVVVLSSNDGCIVARSKEVKAAGVPMGVPYFKVKEELAAMGATVFSSNFPLYRDISQRVMDVLAREVDAVEQYSVDEAFFTVPNLSHDELHAFGLRLKQLVEREVGVPVTIGIAKTKTIAKCATEIGKKGSGVSILADDAWRAAMETFPLHDVWGIGGKTATKMRDAGLATVEDLVRADPARVRELFGVHGARLQLELSEQRTAHGRSAHDLQHSIMSTRSFHRTSTDRAVIEDAVAYHVGHAAEELRELSACAQSVAVVLRTGRHDDWSLRGGVREALLPEPSDDTRVILAEAMRLVATMYERGVPYKKAGVVLSRIVPKETVSASLFESSGETSALLRTVDSLNKRFGSGTLTIGRTRDTGAWSASRAHISPRYTTDWSELKTVVA